MLHVGCTLGLCLRYARSLRLGKPKDFPREDSARRKYWMHQLLQGCFRSGAKHNMLLQLGGTAGTTGYCAQDAEPYV